MKSAWISCEQKVIMNFQLVRFSTIQLSKARPEFVKDVESVHVGVHLGEDNLFQCPRWWIQTIALFSTNTLFVWPVECLLCRCKLSASSIFLYRLCHNIPGKSRLLFYPLDGNLIKSSQRSWMQSLVERMSSSPGVQVGLHLFNFIYFFKVELFYVVLFGDHLLWNKLTHRYAVSYEAYWYWHSLMCFSHSWSMLLFLLGILVLTASRPSLPCCFE